MHLGVLSAALLLLNETLLERSGTFHIEGAVQAAVPHAYRPCVGAQLDICTATHCHTVFGNVAEILTSLMQHAVSDDFQRRGEESLDSKKPHPWTEWCRAPVIWKPLAEGGMM